MANRTVSVALKMLLGEYVPQAEKAAKATEGIGKAAGKSSADYKKGAQQIVAGAGVVALAGAGALYKMASASMDFEKSMSGVSAATNATAGDLKLLREAALQAGADTKFSATEAADAETELAKAGVSTADIMGGALSGALALAAAGQMEVADAAEQAASAMTQFGLSGKDVPHIADLLSAGAGKAQGSVADMGMALNQVGLVANQAGWSIEQTTGVLAEFASAGLLGSDAGTSLKTMLLRLEAPTAEAASLMKSLGISAYDASGALKSPVDVAAALQAGLGKLSAEQRNQALATIFGSDAIRAAAILYKDGAAGAAEWGAKVDDSGFAAEQAAKLMDNLSGDIETLGGSINKALIEGGTAANGVLRVMAQGATGAVNAFANMPAVVQGGAAAMIALGTAAAGAIATLGTVVPKIREGRAALQEMGKAGAVADKAIGKIGKGLAIGSGVLAGLATAGALLKQLQDAAFGAVPGVEQVKGALLEMSDAGKLAQTLPRLADGYGNLGAQIQRLADPSLGDKARKTLTSVFTLGQADPALLRAAKEDIHAIDEALAGLVSSGHAADAEAAFKKIADQANMQGASIDQVKQVLPEYRDALAGVANESKLAGDGIDKSGKAAAGAAKPMSRLEKQAHDLGLEFEDGATASDLLKSAIDRLNGANLDALDTDIAFRESLAKVSESFRENGKSLDLNSTKGQANMATISAMIRAAREHGAAVAQQTNDLDKGNAVFAAHVLQLRKVAEAAGLPKAAVDKLIATYARVQPKVTTDIVTRGAAQAKSSANAVEEALRRIPPKKSTSFATPGAAQAKSSANAVEEAMRRIPKKVTTYVATIYSSATAAEHGLGHRAAGGPVMQGRTYLVGEQGPEMLTMGATGGFVTPNHMLSAMTAGPAPLGMLPGALSSGYAPGAAGSRAGGGGTNAVSLQLQWVGGGGADGEFVNWLQKNIRVRGGNVQAVLGSR